MKGAMTAPTPMAAETWTTLIKGSSGLVLELRVQTLAGRTQGFTRGWVAPCTTKRSWANVCPRTRPQSAACSTRPHTYSVVFIPFEGPRVSGRQKLDFSARSECDGLEGERADVIDDPGPLHWRIVPELAAVCSERCNVARDRTKERSRDMSGSKRFAEMKKQA